uniref:Uncharacterized protein n=1 Tax=Lepeophtheirus salmonis TaxID=72036 RepID=A0A0K2TW36_LEPSM
MPGAQRSWLKQL